MKRDLRRLTNRHYDLLVIGGGITGANIAWDATLRGLRVALIDKQDFGGATSANSLKTVHGGLRYLQDGNLRLVRKMVRERQALLRIAPHLVRPLPVIMPTVKHKFMRSLPILGTAVKLNDLTSFDRNFNLDPARTLPNGRLLSRRALLECVPGLADADAISGGIMWHDAQMVNTERLLLSFLLSAEKAGATIANYVGVDAYLREGNQVVGVKATDQETGTTLDIHARMVVNAAGPWVDQLLHTLNIPSIQPQFRLSTAMNLVTRQILPHHAVGLTSNYVQTMPDGRVERRSRVLFMAPWRDYSLIGTLHAPYDGHPDDNWLTEKTIGDFIDEVNQAYPAARLQREDVHLVHRGFLPMIPSNADPTTVKLVREGQVVDHAENGILGLVTAVGVKYTTGRYLAEKTVDLVYRKLQQAKATCRTRHARLVGGHIHHWDTFVMAAMEKWPLEMPPYQLERILTNYGNTHRLLLPYMLDNVAWSQPVGDDTAVTKAEIIHAVRAEMAQHLSDVVLRRTDMGSAKPPTTATLTATAELMAAELGWDKARVATEIDAVWTTYDTQIRG